jgi:hypothetical protein
VEASPRPSETPADELLRLYRQTEDEIRRIEGLADAAKERTKLPFLRSRLRHYRLQGMRARTDEIASADMNVAPLTHTALADEERYRERWLSRNRPYL